MYEPAAVLTGGDALVDLLEEHGVEVAFGVVSVHNLPLVDALDRRLRFVPVRHEAAAVNAADGYGRARGPFGVAVTSTGTGAGNAAGSLVEALSAGSRLLHITGQISAAYLGQGRGVIHETKDQLGMLRAVSAFAATISSAETAEGVLRAAVEATLTPPGGPASVEWPIDLQYLATPDRFVSRTQSGGSTDDGALARAVELVVGARRPLVWAGGGAIGAGAAIARLLEHTGAGLLTSNAGRGVVPEDDPRCIGNFAASPACAELLAAADLLISIGTHFRSNETRDFTLSLPRPHVQIDVDATALGRSYPIDVGLTGDAADVLDRLLARLPPPPRSPSPALERSSAGLVSPAMSSAVAEGWGETVTAARWKARGELRGRIGAQARICDEMRAALPRDAILARDVTIPSSTWGNRLLEVYEPGTNVYARGGGIGQGLAMGIGAALGRPDVPTVVLVGDGGLAVHLGELLTLVQEGLWLTVVVFDDRGYGVLRNMQDRYVGRRSGVDLHTPDFGALGAAVGLPHEAVDDVAAFRPALDRALARPGPAMIVVDVTAIGDMPEPFVPPVHVPTSPTAGSP